LILSLSSIADDFPPWGADPAGLDTKLREFWPTESYLQSSLYAIATRNAAFSWTLQGSDALVEICRGMLTENWIDICYKWNIDYLTQNNGAFVEIIREQDSPESPCIGINHLDSARCHRTGVPEYPVVYVDIFGGQHKLAPHNVWAMSDMPSPIETMNGVGMCAVYRILREAQRMRDISVHDREKISGFNTKGFILVNNIGQRQMQDMLKQHTEIQLQKGYVRYLKPAIYGSLDPSKPATAQVVDLAAMPDGFDKDKELKWYITILALALGCDYQDLAPLASGALGSSTQSATLHLKSKGKGPAMYMKRFAHMMNFSGILPQSVEFEFDEKDVEDDIQQQNLAGAKATERQSYISSGVKSALAVRTEMLEAGEITQEIFDLMAKEDIVRKQEEEAKRLEQAERLNAIRPNNPTDTTQEDESAQGGDISGPKTEDEGASGGPTVRMRKNCGPGLHRHGQYDYCHPTDTQHGKEVRSDYSDELRRKLEKRLAKDVGASLKKALALLRGRLQAEVSEKAVSDIPNDPELWRLIRAEMSKALVPNARQIAQEVIGYRTEVGIDMDRVNVQLLEFTRNYGGEWDKWFTPNTQEGLREALATWQESGLGKRGFPDLVKALEETLFSPERAQRIATTETTRVWDEANLIVDDALGLEEQEWMAAGDEHMCDTPITYAGETYYGCEDLNGKRFPLHEGPRPPSDTHVGCRCSRVGVPVGR
jgi:hypothetical protein